MYNNDYTISPGGHIHLMGICGVAMSSIAGMLKEKGYTITGSDQNTYPPISTFLNQASQYKPLVFKTLGLSTIILLFFISSFIFMVSFLRRNDVEEIRAIRRGGL